MLCKHETMNGYTSQVSKYTSRVYEDRKIKHLTRYRIARGEMEMRSDTAVLPGVGSIRPLDFGYNMYKTRVQRGHNYEMKDDRPEWLECSICGSGMTSAQSNNVVWWFIIISMSSRSYFTAVKLLSGSVSGDRNAVGANTMARFSALIMFLFCCSVTLVKERWDYSLSSSQQNSRL